MMNPSLAAEVFSRATLDVIEKNNKAFTWQWMFSLYGPMSGAEHEQVRFLAILLDNNAFEQGVPQELKWWMRCRTGDQETSVPEYLLEDKSRTGAKSYLQVAYALLTKAESVTTEGPEGGRLLVVRVKAE